MRVWSISSTNFLVEQKEQQASSNNCTYSGDEMVLECAEDVKIQRKEVILYYIVVI